MRVLLKFLLDCDPSAAWRALQSPTAFREVAMPWVDFSSLDPGGFAPTWTEGSHAVRVQAFGALPVGEQRIELSVPATRVPGVRILRDTGGGTRGLLALVPHIDHRMAIAPDPAGPDADGRIKTLYRDQLIVKAGALTPLAWCGMWAFWQWRGVRLRQLAPTWAYDPVPPDADADARADAEQEPTP